MRGSDLSEDVVLIISTLSSMEAKIEVGEHEVIYVKEGDRAEVEIDAFPDRQFPAQVVEVARNATVKNQGTEGEVTTFYVRLALTDTVPGALPGMSTQATISTDTHQDAVVVPIQSVTVRPEKDLTGTGPALEDRNAPAAGVAGTARKVRDPLRRCVFVVEDGRARVRPVETGLASETEIENHQRVEGRGTGGGGSVPDPVPGAGGREGGDGGEGGEWQGWEGVNVKRTVLRTRTRTRHPSPGPVSHVPWPLIPGPLRDSGTGRGTGHTGRGAWITGNGFGFGHGFGRGAVGIA